MAFARSFSIVVILMICSPSLVFSRNSVNIVLLHRRSENGECGLTTSVAALQRETTAVWASEIINNQTNPNLYSISTEVLDTCGDAKMAAIHALRIVNETTRKPLLGVVAVEEPHVLAEAAAILKLHKIPLVVASPRASEVLLYSQKPQEDQGEDSFNNIFSAAPNGASIARATMAVAKGIQSASVRIVGTCPHTLKAAMTSAKQLRISVISSQLWQRNSTSVAKFIDSLPLGTGKGSQTFLVLMEPAELHSFMSEVLKKSAGRQVTWVLGSFGSVGAQVISHWALSLGSTSFLTEPHMPELAGLAQYLDDNGIAHQPLDTEVPYIVQAVSALGAAFHLYELTACDSASSGDTFKCNAEKLHVSKPEILPEQMLLSLRKLSIPSASSSSPPSSRTQKTTLSASPREIEGASNHFTPSGRLVANKYLVQKLIAGTGETSPVAWYSDDDGLVLAAMLNPQSNGRFYFFGHSSAGPSLVPVQPFVAVDELQEAVTKNPETTTKPTPLAETLDVTTTQITDVPNEIQLRQEDIIVTINPADENHPSFFLSRTWAAAIVAIAATQVLGALYILVFVIISMCDGSVKGSQFLGLLLLLSLIGELASVVFFVLPHTAPVCYFKTFIPPLFLALSLAILLAKLLQLRGLVSAGLGGEVPQSPLYLTILLAIGVQAAVSGHFFTKQQLAEPKLECNTSPEDLPFLYLYLLILASITAAYAVSLRHVRRNHSEAQLILIASSLSVPVFGGWVLTCFLAPAEYYDAATAVLLVLLGAILLGAVFIPKMATLGRMRREMTLKKGSHSPALAPSPSNASSMTSKTAFTSTTTLWMSNTMMKSGSTAAPSVLSGSNLIHHPLYAVHSFKR